MSFGKPTSSFYHHLCNRSKIKEMENLPIYISILFILTTLTTIVIFYKASNNSKPTLIILLLWLVAQTIISLTGFYTITDTIPPRFPLLVAPAMVLIIILFITKKGKQYIDGFNIKTLTILHIIRIPVEMILFWLFVHGTIPQLMTFEGRNFDIISGITAPLIYYFGFIKSRPKKMLLLIWNFICLGLLINIVVNAILSAPSPFQQFAFDQPNRAILYFPFVWLPSCVVPLVLFSHLASIRQLLNIRSKE